MKMKKEGLRAFRLNGRQFYFRNEKIKTLYEGLGLLLCFVEFYFLSLVFYAIVKY